MATFIKAQAASLTATVVDFTVTVLLKECSIAGTCWRVYLGTMSGGVVNFMMNRSWVFRARIKRSITRRSNISGMGWQPGIGFGRRFPLNELWGVSYLISKISVSLFVGFFYNYILQKNLCLNSLE
jgi:putative flippase GtrA